MTIEQTKQILQDLQNQVFVSDRGERFKVYGLTFAGNYVSAKIDLQKLGNFDIKSESFEDFFKYYTIEGGNDNR